MKKLTKKQFSNCLGNLSKIYTASSYLESQIENTLDSMFEYACFVVGNNHNSIGLGNKEESNLSLTICFINGMYDDIEMILSEESLKELYTAKTPIELHEVALNHEYEG